MYIDRVRNQWISEKDDVLKFGEKLGEELLSYGNEVIPAGTVMVYAREGKPNAMFQTLRDLLIRSLSNNTIMPYEEGSVVPIVPIDWKGYLDLVPRFKDCRMPTYFEMSVYEAAETV